MVDYDLELYEDNAGRKHLFALRDGVPFAGFTDDGYEEFIRATLSDPGDPSDWDGQYGDDQCAEKTHTQQDIAAAYEEITDWVKSRSGGAWEIDIAEFVGA